MVMQMIDQTLEQILIEVLNMSLTASVMILAVLLARVVLCRMPRIFSYVLWLVVLFRLLCPISFESQLSLLGALDSQAATEGRMEYIPQDIGYQQEPNVQLPVPALENSLNDSLPEGNPRGSVNPLQIVLYVTGRIWVLGMLGMLVYSGVSLGKLRRRLKGAVWERDNLYRMSGRTTPFVYGLLRPRIYLPEHVKGEEQEYILLHEQIHIRRGDQVYRLLAWLALCVHWFNPFVWAAFSLSGKDMEVSCDEAVIRKMGSGVKKEYSASLLNVAAGQQIVKGIPLAFGESDTGSRIRHVLRYRKPAGILVGVTAAICVILAVVMIANPADDDAEIACYGIVREAENTNGMPVVYIPSVGDVQIPFSELYEYKTEPVNSFPVVGSLLKISFPADSEVLIQESAPAVFTEDAACVTILEKGFAIEYEGYDYFLLGLPQRLLEEGARDIADADLPDRTETVKTGDTLQILRTYPEKKELLLASTEVLLVDETAEQFWVELTRSEVEAFLAEYDMGMRLELIRFIQEEESFEEILGEWKDSWEFDPVNIADGTYSIPIRSLSRSARCVDSYIQHTEREEVPSLAFAENCKFLVNVEMDSVRYEEVSFDGFADLVMDNGGGIVAPCYLTFENGLITKAILQSQYFKYGIRYEAYAEDTWYEYLQTAPELEGVDVMETYYTLAETVTADIGDGRGQERLEVYTGNIGDGDSGVVLFYSEQGELLHAETAHAARAGWNNIYLGEAEGMPYILTVHIEERDTFGGHGYQVYRLDRFGEVQQIAGSFFEFDDGRTPYDDGLFREWVSELEYYLEHSHLILSSQESEIRTEQVCELEKYNYETLRRGR